MKTKRFFQFLFFVAALFMLQSCADEEIQSDQVIIVEADDPNYRYAVGPGTPYDQLDVCYNGGIAVDYDCDGSYEVGWNHSTSTASSCQQLVAQKIATAQANGWCWTLDLHPNNCQASSCWKM